VLNPTFTSRSGESSWRSWARWIATRLRRVRLSDRLVTIPARARVQEVSEYTDDLLPRLSPFSFRFAPDADYLRWRYRPGLSFVRYRVFRVLADERTCGYVVLNDQPGTVLVAHCDGDNASDLACGVLLSLGTATAADSRLREVRLTSTHPKMQTIFRAFGFRDARSDRQFAVVDTESEPRPSGSGRSAPPLPDGRGSDNPDRSEIHRPCRS
jgi:hypothetical protein